MTRYDAFQWMIDHPWSFPLSIVAAFAIGLAFRLLFGR